MMKKWNKLWAVLLALAIALSLAACGGSPSQEETGDGTEETEQSESAESTADAEEETADLQDAGESTDEAGAESTDDAAEPEAGEDTQEAGEDAAESTETAAPADNGSQDTPQNNNTSGGSTAADTPSKNSGTTGGNNAAGGNNSSGGNASTGGNASSGGNTTSDGSDLEYVRKKGTLVVGITEFEPMDYQQENGEWVGFDADMANLFAEHLGVKAVFQLINWDSKVFELNGKTIDVVWNGMTLTDEVKSAMECSRAYFDNGQVAIVKAADADKYQTVDSLKGLAFAVESGSAGQAMAEANGFIFTEVQDQATALLEVSSGTADAAIIDFLMAKSMIGDGTSYEDLTYTVQLNSEEYGVGFRKGSDLATVLNDFFRESYEDGSMQRAAEAYAIEDFLIPQVG